MRWCRWFKSSFIIYAEVRCCPLRLTHPGSAKKRIRLSEQGEQLVLFARRIRAPKRLLPHLVRGGLATIAD